MDIIIKLGAGVEIMWIFKTNAVVFVFTWCASSSRTSFSKNEKQIDSPPLTAPIKLNQPYQADCLSIPRQILLYYSIFNGNVTVCFFPLCD